VGGRGGSGRAVSSRLDHVASNGWTCLPRGDNQEKRWLGQLFPSRGIQQGFGGRGGLQTLSLSLSLYLFFDRELPPLLLLPRAPSDSRGRNRVYPPSQPSCEMTWENIQIAGSAPCTWLTSTASSSPVLPVESDGHTPMNSWHVATTLSSATSPPRLTLLPR
jgi:hypothetical protein